MNRLRTEVNSPTGSDGPGATSQKTVSVRGRDGSLFSTRVYHCINATTDPDLRDALLSGELFDVADPGGDDTYRLALALRYHDPAREIFALVIPEALRHRELELRSGLLDEFAAFDGELPDYMRAFETVVGVDELRRLEEQTLAELDSGDQEGAHEVTRVDQSRDEVIEELAEIDEERARLDEHREQLDEERARIERERASFEEERAAFERDRERLEAERRDLDEERSRLEAARLNLEQKRRRLEEGETSRREESTEVVTDSQFIEVVDQDDLGGGPTHVPSVQARGVNLAPADFELEDARTVTDYQGRLLAAAAVSSKVHEHLQEADELTFFVQLDDTHDYPLVGLLLAALDEDGQEIASVGWALDVSDSEDSALLDALVEQMSLRVVLYDRDGEASAVFDVAAPLEENLAWIEEHAKARLEELGEEAGSFEAAARRWRRGANGRIDRMRHNFSSERFSDMENLADLALATGVVGFWSTPERFEYLVAHRSYPIDQFESLRERVVEAAVEHGLHLNEPLRQIAVGLGLASDESSLIERLIAEFAEVTVGLRNNDLDPIKEWENWEALVGAAEKLGVQVDPDVLELAEASLNRARRFEESAPTQPA